MMAGLAGDGGARSPSDDLAHFFQQNRRAVHGGATRLFLAEFCLFLISQIP